MAPVPFGQHTGCFDLDISVLIPILSAAGLNKADETVLSLSAHKGYMYPDPGLPYRRPLPGAFPLGPMGPPPPRRPGPAEPHSFGPHPGDKSGENPPFCPFLSLYYSAV